MSDFVMGWFLPKGINVQPEPVLVPSDAQAIADLIGCSLIDAVRHTVGHDDGHQTTIVGYVDDEGLLGEIGLGDVNHLATKLFHRDEHLVGNVVVVGGLNAAGLYDGDNHDIPDWLFGCADDLTEMAAMDYNQSVAVVAAVLSSLQDGVISSDELSELLEQDDVAPEFYELLKVAISYVMLRAEDEVNGVDDSMGDAIARLLEGEV